MTESRSTDFTERVCTLLHEISQGRCSIGDADVYALPDENQQAVFTAALMLHEEMEYQAQLRAQARERRDALIDLAKVGIWDCDATSVLNHLRELGDNASDLLDRDDALVRVLFEKLTINGINKEGLRMLGSASLEALVSRRRELIDESSTPLFRELWKALAVGERRVELEGRLTPLIGRTMHVVMGVTVPRSHEGFTILTVADVSEHHQRRAAERAAAEKAAALEQVNTEVERLFYAVSHDMRAPLRSVYNLAEWAIEDLKDGDADSVYEHMNALRGRIARLEAMMNDLLTYARVGRVEREIEEVDVAALVKELGPLSALPDGFAIEASGSLPMINTVRTLLTQVFLNLVGNAVKHHDKESGKIVISAEDRPDGMVELRVSDDGPGIPAEYRTTVFDLFSTLKPRDEVEGSGMGLAFVHKAMQSIGGRVAIVGPEGRGTTFALTCPRTLAEAVKDPVE